MHGRSRPTDRSWPARHCDLATVPVVQRPGRLFVPVKNSISPNHGLGKTPWTGRRRELGLHARPAQNHTGDRHGRAPLRQPASERFPVGNRTRLSAGNDEGQSSRFRARRQRHRTQPKNRKCGSEVDCGGRSRYEGYRAVQACQFLSATSNSARRASRVAATSSGVAAGPAGRAPGRGAGTPVLWGRGPTAAAPACAP